MVNLHHERFALKGNLKTDNTNQLHTKVAAVPGG